MFITLACSTSKQSHDKAGQGMMTLPTSYISHTRTGL